MRYRLATPLALLLGTLCLTPRAFAQIADPGFEQAGTFGVNWDAIGFATQVGSGFGINPTEGSLQALLTNDLTSGAIDVDLLQALVDLPPGALTGMGNGTAINGSAISQIFTLAAPSTITLDWNFLTAEDPNFDPQNDFAFLSIDGNLVTLGAFGDANAPLPLTGLPSPSVDDFLSETGYHSFTSVALAPGDHSLILGVVNVGTNDIASALLIDNIVVNAAPVGAPEPGALALLALGLVGGIAARRRVR